MASTAQHPAVAGRPDDLRMPTYDTIVAGVDLSPRSSLVLEAAVGAAEVLRARSLHLVHVMDSVVAWPLSADPAGPQGAPAWQARLDEVRDGLAALATPPSLGASTAREIRFGTPVEGLVARASELRAGLLIVASRGFAGLSGPLAGSVAHTLLRAAHGPVMVVGEGRAWIRPRLIVAVIDASPLASRVVTQALTIADRTESELEIAFCHQSAQGRSEPLSSAASDEVSAAALERARALASAHRPVTVRRGGAAAILAATHRREATWVVMGASAGARWSTTTTCTVVEAATCPVVVIPESVLHG